MNTGLKWSKCKYENICSKVKDVDDLSHLTDCYKSLYLKYITMTLCQNQQLSS